MKQSINGQLIIRILVILVLMLRIFTVHGQQGNRGDTTIFSGAEMTFVAGHDFVKVIQGYSAAVPLLFSNAVSCNRAAGEPGGVRCSQQFFLSAMNRPDK